MIEKNEGIVAEGDDYIEACVGISQWNDKDGLLILEEDFVGRGEIWRVHKNDPDPFPSRPHAHCKEGPKRFVGCKLHLGTAELFKGHEALGRFLDRKQFLRLIEHFQPKFPDITLPLAHF